MSRFFGLIFLLLVIPGMGARALSRPGIPQKHPEGIRGNGQVADSEPNLDGVVEVSFRLDSQGKVQILNINSTSPQLSDYVIKKLSKIQLDSNSSELGKIIKYRFVFKKQT